MNLSLQPITAANRKEALTLKTALGQETYVESVEQCLKEADASSCWRPVAIYDDGLLIGFAMYGFFPEYLPSGRVWMDRLLIDCLLYTSQSAPPGEFLLCQHTKESETAASFWMFRNNY